MDRDSLLIDDIELSVYSYIVTVSHVWPGVTPLNVWDLPYDMWLVFVAAADQWIAKRKQEAGD